MKISELMERLGELQAEHGDCEVYAYNMDGDRDVPIPEYVKDDDDYEWVIL